MFSLISDYYIYFFLSFINLQFKAKKMNVESLRSGDQSGESAEVKIAKVYL